MLPMLSHKTFLSAALPLALVAALSSCIEEKSDSQKFQAVVQGYVIQDYAADSSLVFKPYITVASNLSDQPLKSVVVAGLNGNLKMVKRTDYVYDTDPDAEATKELSKLNGTYNVSITSTNDLVATSSISISIADKDALGRLSTNKLDFDGQYVTVQVPKVHNASAYGVSILPFDKKEAPSRINTYYKVAQYPSVDKVDADTVVNYTISFQRSQLGTDSAIIRAYVSGSSGLFQESDSSIHVAKD